MITLAPTYFFNNVNNENNENNVGNVSNVSNAVTRQLGNSLAIYTHTRVYTQHIATHPSGLATANATLLAWRSSSGLEEGTL